MNIKLHTPKSLKAGSGLSSWRQFMLSILATTISIVLTFGTAAVIDNNKKQNEKHEIVMMVMYDMYNSLKSIEEADSAIRKEMHIQLQLAKDTTKFKDLWAELITNMPTAEYTETTEQIFSSSIETINTVGNVLFTENVAEFYQIRKEYKTTISDSLKNELINKTSIETVNDALKLQYKSYAMVSGVLLAKMQHLLAQCQQIMDVKDNELEAYRIKREQMENNISEERQKKIMLIQEVSELQDEIDKAKKKLNLK